MKKSNVSVVARQLERFANADGVKLKRVLLEGFAKGMLWLRVDGKGRLRYVFPNPKLLVDRRALD